MCQTKRRRALVRSNSSRDSLTWAGKSVAAAELICSRLFNRDFFVPPMPLKTYCTPAFTIAARTARDSCNPVAVQTSSIVERLDPLKDGLSSFLTSRIILLVNKLLLQARKETLRHNIVPAVHFPAHTAPNLMTNQRRVKMA